MTAANSPLTTRQNDDEHLTRLLAYSHEYRQAQRWHTVRMVVTIGLALASPPIVIIAPSVGDYIAAVAALWLVLGRTMFSAAEEAHKARAASIQELYDTRLFNLPWNPALAGRTPAPEDVAAAADRHRKKAAEYKDWYTVDVSGLPWPADVLLCQRQSAVWSRRDHRAYSITLATVAMAWLVLGMAIGVIRDMTLADWLVKLFLPSAPAYLDAAELALAHWRHAKARAEFEEDISDLWSGRRAHPEVPTGADCRRVQDRAYSLRRHGPRVPTWFYKLRKPTMARSTVAGAKALIEDSRNEPSSGRPPG